MFFFLLPGRWHVLDRVDQPAQIMSHFSLLLHEVGQSALLRAGVSHVQISVTNYKPITTEQNNKTLSIYGFKRTCSLKVTRETEQISIVIVLGGHDLLLLLLVLCHHLMLKFSTNMTLSLRERKIEDSLTG